MSEHDAFLDDAAAWVLGALDEDEAWRFAAHLEVCAVCRTEVERLAAASDALPLLAAPVEPPSELRGRLMAVVRDEAEARRIAAGGHKETRSPFSVRRWHSPRPLVAALAAACLLVAAGAIGWAVHGGGAPASHVTPGHVVASRAPRGRAELVQSGGQAVLRMSRMPLPAAGRVYQAWVVRDHEPPRPDGVFTVDAGGTGSLALRTALRGARTVMVTVEPRGGSPVPTSPPLVIVHPT